MTVTGMNEENSKIEEIEQGLFDVTMAIIAILNATKTIVKINDTIITKWSSANSIKELEYGIFSLGNAYSKMIDNNKLLENSVKVFNDEKDYLNNQIENLKNELSILNLTNSQLKKLRENNFHLLNKGEPVWVARHHVEKKKNCEYLGIMPRTRKTQIKPHHYIRVSTLREAIKFSNRGALLALCQDMKRNRINYENIKNPQNFRVCRITLVEEP